MIVFAIAIASAVASLPADAVHARAPAQSPPGRGSIAYGLEAETASGWCPTSARLAVSGIEVGAAIYDTLVVPNQQGRIVPYLARSIDHDPQYTRWTIALREGIAFHDGTPLTADAVKLNLDAYRTNPIIGSALKDISDVTVNGPTQLTITTARSWVAFPWFLYLSGRLLIVAPAQLANPDTCARNLVGTGPFRFDHWTLNQELVVTRNPRYWQRDADGVRLPYLDSITFRPIADGGQRVDALRAGQLDMIHTSDGLQIDTLGRAGLIRMHEAPGRRSVRYYQLNTGRPPFDDLGARSAVALAIDRRAINEIRNAGVFDVATGPFDRDVPGYLEDPGYPRPDPDRAASLVAAYKAGHGGSFHVAIGHTDDSGEAAEAQLVQEQLDKVGIDATLHRYDQTSFILAAVTGDLDVLLLRNHPGEDPDVNYQWWSAGSRLNFGRFTDLTLQDLLDRGRGETDPVERRRIYEQVNRRFAEQRFDIWAYALEWVIAGRRNVRGLGGPPLPDGGGRPLFVNGRHSLLGVFVQS